MATRRTRILRIAADFYISVVIRLICVIRVAIDSQAAAKSAVIRKIRVICVPIIAALGGAN
jgi:hypothetical protein